MVKALATAVLVLLMLAMSVATVAAEPIGGCC